MPVVEGDGSPVLTFRKLCLYVMNTFRLVNHVHIFYQSHTQLLLRGFLVVMSFAMKSFSSTWVVK